MSTPLHTHYKEVVQGKLKEQFAISNTHAVPRIDSVVLSGTTKEAITNLKALDALAGDLSKIATQKAVITHARKSISTFKLREGMPIGARVTLRGAQMYHFLSRFINVALPRVRDFRGLKSKSFDGRGNYSVGIKEQIIFSEIDYDKIDRIRGLSITVKTTAKNDEQAYYLLKHMGMPFRN